MAIDTQFHEQQYKNPSAGMILSGIFAGSALEKLTKTAGKHISCSIGKKMKEMGNSLTADEFSKMETAVKNSIEKTGLKAKGVSLLTVKADTLKQTEEVIKDCINNSILKYYPERVREKSILRMLENVKNGDNAFFTFNSNKIVIPEIGHKICVFHELGHAINSNLSTFGRFLQKCRPLSMLFIPIGIIALFKTKKAEGEASTGYIDKTTTFIKNNAGKLTFLAFLPTVIEEGMASIRGGDFAKQLLSPNLANKVTKVHRLSFLTYLTSSIASGLGIYLGTKLKDTIASRKAVNSNK